MNSFNKIFKQIVIENNIQIESEFPEQFTFIDYGLEFIFDIMPTFGQKYIWHTVNDLQSIPELVLTLKNTDIDILNGIADGFQDAAAAEEQEYPQEEFQQPNNFREIAKWIRTIKYSDTTIMNQNQDINIHDKECFNTVPNVVKEVPARSYRRGLKALSIDNRKKFNAERQAELATNENDTLSKTDKINKVKNPKLLQQPVSKTTIMPQPGVNRPVGLNRTDRIKHTFSNIVYTPSITQLTKEAAKKRCIANRKAAKTVVSENTNDLQFSTNYAQKPVPHIQPAKPIQITQLPDKKELCIVCKEYVIPKETKINGKVIKECPKCGLRLTSNNY